MFVAMTHDDIIRNTPNYKDRRYFTSVEIRTYLAEALEKAAVSGSFPETEWRPVKCEDGGCPSLIWENISNIKHLNVKRLKPKSSESLKAILLQSWSMAVTLKSATISTRVLPYGWNVSVVN